MPKGGRISASDASPVSAEPGAVGEPTGDGSSAADDLLRAVARIEEVEPPEIEALSAGKRVADFEIVSELGRGGMGIVYLADDRRLRRRVALKVLPSALAMDDERRHRLLREARAAAAIAHPNIAAVHEGGEWEGRVYVAMEWVHGESLRARMDASPLGIEEVLGLAAQVLRGLGAAHTAGLVHRDVKPDNVMVTGEGVVKILDFGLAKRITLHAAAAESTLVTRQGQLLGTPAYMSPEQALGDEVDQRSDIFSFGVMLYEMLIGRRPFAGATTSELLRALLTAKPEPPQRARADVGERLSKVTLRCLAKQPARRHQDCASLERDLAAAHAADRRVGASTTRPARRASTAAEGNLPVVRDRLIGREADVEAVLSLLRDRSGGAVTLTGPGGIGKTRLALAVAAAARVDPFSDGAYFVDLAPLTDAGLVASSIAAALRVRETGERPLIEDVERSLGKRQVLLVLDNFEHVLGAATVVSRLLAALPSLGVLVTSRAPLRIVGEREHAVDALEVAARGAAADTGLHSAAVELFLQRARGVRPGFAPTADNVEAVVEICRKLEGVPLAIELAAARIRHLSPGALLARLGDRLGLLIGGGRDAPDRHRSLRAAIAWSQSMLDEEQRRLFAELSVFAGGFTLEAAEAVCGSREGKPVLEPLAALVESSLLRLGAGTAGDRYGMLETVRELAGSELTARGDGEDVARRHARYFLSMAEEAAAASWRPAMPGWAARLEAEEGNLLRVLSRADDDTAARLAAALWPYWMLGSRFEDAARWLAHALGEAGPRTTTTRATLLLGAGALTPRVPANGVAARARLMESIEAFAALGDEAGAALARYNLSLWHAVGGDYAAAEARAVEALSTWQRIGDEMKVSWALNALGEHARARGDHGAARDWYQQAVHAELRSPGICNQPAFINLAAAECKLGRLHVATSLLIDAYARLGAAERLTTGDWLLVCGHLAAARGEAERAVRLLAVASAHLRALGARFLPWDQADLEHEVAGARARLGDGLVDRVWAEGDATDVRVGVLDAAEWLTSSGATMGP